MSNLGRYQDIVVAAKEAGGVDVLIERIEAGAVAQAAPRIVVGTAVGVVALGATAFGAFKLIQERRSATIASGEQAKEELRTITELKQEGGDGLD